MQKNLFSRFFFLMGFVLFVSACSTPSTDTADTKPADPTAPSAPSAPSDRELHRMTFSEMPGWEKDSLSEVMPAFLNSCRVLKKRKEWQKICLGAEEMGQKEENEIRTFFETSLEPWQVVIKGGRKTGMITGYYEPVLHGSRTKHAKYQIPLYNVPSDLISVDLSTVYPQLKGMRLRGRLKGNRLVAYPARAEIRQKKDFSGQEIVWVNDAVDAFFLQVQGSGRVLLDETGEMIRVAYADQNGHPYRSIGRHLVDRGEMKLGEVSAQRIRAWLKKYPYRLNEVLDANPSYVFFREEKLDSPLSGPKGALGVPLTAMRSVAVDPRHIPLGLPLFIDTTQPDSDEPLRKMVMAQDTGGAIKGIIRLDYFWGSGNEAGELAGKMKQPVRIWILQPKKHPDIRENQPALPVNQNRDG